MKNKMKPNPKVQKKTGTKPKPCWACGQVGHYAKFCPKKKNQSNMSNTKAQANVVTAPAIGLLPSNLN